MDKAKKLYFNLYPFFDFVESGLLIGVCKGGLNLRGRNVGLPRKPILPLTNEDMIYLKNLLENIKLK